MKFVRAGKGYINYGLIPKNEYAADNAEKSAADAAALALDPTLEDAAYKQHLLKQQVWHASGRRSMRGLTRLWKVNGWRAEAASQDDELTGMESYTDAVRKNSSPL